MSMPDCLPLRLRVRFVAPSLYIRVSPSYLTTMILYYFFFLFSDLFFCFYCVLYVAIDEGWLDGWARGLLGTASAHVD